MPTLPIPSALGLLTLVLTAVLMPGARAEKADRSLPLAIEADQSTVDMARKVMVFSGRVVLTQGTLRILAERVEVTDVGQGQRTAAATGSPDKPAELREKRDGVDEFVEGRAQLIEYDSRESLIRLTGKALVRRLRGTLVADELQGESIIWNGGRDLFNVASGARAGAEPDSPRVRGVFTPPPPAASAPVANPPRR